MNKKKSKSVIYYPIFLNLRGKRCVVIGGGNVALRKVKALLDCGANVTMISPKPTPEIVKLSKKRAIHFIQRDYEKEDLGDAAIAFACTDVKKVNRKVAVDAKEAGVLVNVADDPRPSDFIIPSFFRKGNLTVAISTAGVSPALARKIRAKLEKSLGEEYALLLSIIGEVRSTIREKGIMVSVEAWQGALDLDLLIKLVQAGQREKAKAFLLNKLKAYRGGHKFIR
jgi:precorrin-2 dehydrogenase / sirohydrochlorin ferrochelatase